MLNYSDSNISFRITPTGVLDKIVLDNVSLIKKIPMYFFAHIDYSRRTPGCIPFDDSPIISNFDVRPNYVEYTKEFIMQDGVRFFIDVSLSFNEEILLDLNVRTDSKENIRYGFVMPLKPDYFDDGTKDYYPVINYLTHWDRKWNDQTYVRMPMFTSLLDDNKISVLNGFSEDSQFFVHNQESETCVKVSTSTEKTKKLSSVIVKHVGGNEKTYVKYFPEADKSIFFWKVLIKKLERKHGVTLDWNMDWDKKEVSFHKVDVHEINEAMEIIDNEIKKHPIKLKDLGISEIILCKNLHLNGNKVSGINNRTRIILDISGEFTETIHHEIFHSIAKNASKQMSERWHSIDDIPSLFERGDHEEEMCDLFGKMMAETHLTQSLSEEFPDLKERTEIIESLYATTGKNLVWQKDIRQMAVPLKHETSANNLKKTKKKVLLGKNNATLVCGIDDDILKTAKHVLSYLDSDLSVAEEYVNDDSDHKFILCKIENIDDFNYVNSLVPSKVLWFIRHPQNYVSLRHTENSESQTLSLFNEWAEKNSVFNEIIMLKNLIRIEDVAIDMHGILNRISKFSKVPVLSEVQEIEIDIEDEQVPYLEKIINNTEYTEILTTARYMGVY